MTDTPELLEEISDLSNLMITMGYGAEARAITLEAKLANKEKNKIAENIPVRKLWPARYIYDAALTHYKKSFADLKEAQRDKILWTLGINTKDFPLLLDGGCYGWEGRQECGVFFLGAERTDKQWLNLVIEGRNVASMDVRLTQEEREVMHTQRTNTKG